MSQFWASPLRWIDGASNFGWNFATNWWFLVLSAAHTWPLSSFWWCIDHIELSYDYTSELDQWSLQPFIKSIRQLLKWAEPPTWSQGSQSQRIKKTKEMSAKTFCQSKKLLRLESNLATFYPSFPCEKGQYFRQHPFQLFAFPSLPNFNVLPLRHRCC